MVEEQGAQGVEMSEIMNAEELEKITVGAPYAADHCHLLAGLRTRYPYSRFTLLGGGGPWTYYESAMVDRKGVLVSDNYEKWLRTRFHEAGDDARAVYDQFKESGLRKVETKGETLIIAVPFNDEPDGFSQIEISAKRRIAEIYLCGKNSPPEDWDDLICSSSLAETPLEISQWEYTFDKITNIQSFVREMVQLDYDRRQAAMSDIKNKTILVGDGDSRGLMKEVRILELHPDLFDQPMAEARFLADWQESRAGRYRLCDYWWLKIADYTDDQGRRRLGFIPALTCRNYDLQGVEAKDYRSVYGLMEALDDFDHRAGYPFAWFFHMCHGNRIGHRVGGIVIEGIKDGKIALPKCDAAVLLRWSNSGYGF